MAEYKDTKEALEFALVTAMQADESLQDGFQWTDIFSFIQALSKLPAAIEGIENVPSEIAKLKTDQVGKQALIDYVKNLYDIDDKYAEELVEQGVVVGLELGVLITMLRKIKK